MRLYFLDNGWLEGDINWMVSLHTYGTKQNKTVSSVWSKFPVYCVLIDTGEKKILYDTGSHPSDYDLSNRFPYYFNEDQHLLNQLALIGLTPDDIDVVVLSHLHDDHCGNISLFKGKRILVDEQEYNYVMSGSPRGPYKRILKEEGIQPELISCDMKFDEGIQIVRLPGHSAGLLGLLLQLKNENFLLTMDAVNTSYNYQNPPVLAAGLYDNEAYIRSMKRIMSLQEKYHARVIFGHDIDQFEGLRHAPDYYE